MAFTVRCSTLFDITQTGIISRRNANNDDPSWILKRNQQCNFDTVLQAISLRSQPENITVPAKKLLLNNHKFGLSDNEIPATQIHFWEFEFDINYTSVYNNSIDELGHLYSDCDKIPMIKCNTEWINLHNYLDTNVDTRNIYFEVIKNAIR